MVFTGCGQKERLFELRYPAETGITFKNQLTSNDSINLPNFEYFYNGGSVAMVNLNNDGLPDIYFTGNMVYGSLYLNKGKFEIEDMSA